MAALQNAREEHVAAELAAMLEAAEGGAEQFELYVRVKAEADLGRAPYGDVMLVTLGRIYDNQARIASGGLVEGTMARCGHAGADGLGSNGLGAGARS